jgi:phosphatidylglycerophosphatase A
MKKLLIPFFGLGYLPIAPGTWGSAGAIVVYAGIWMVAHYSGLFFSPNHISIVFLVLSAIMYAVGVGGGRWAVETFKSDDPKPFVLDEVVGMWVSLLFLPITGITWLLWILMVQFLVFRCFDIVKPSPARQSEHLPFGWGIMTDDVVAGIYANLVGQILFRFIVPMLFQG